MKGIDLAENLAAIDEPFSPRIVAYYNDNKVQVAKTRGPFVWHSHPETDDFFLVLSGRLVIELRDGGVCSRPGNSSSSRAGSSTGRGRTARRMSS